MDKARAHKLLPLVKNKEAYLALMDYLQQEEHQTVSQLKAELSPVKISQLQGRVALVDRLLNLKKIVEAELDDS